MSEAGVRSWPVPRTGARFYYGWVVLAVAALAMVGTLPGRTQGLGLITEHFSGSRDQPRRLRPDQPAATLSAGCSASALAVCSTAGQRIVLTGVAFALGVVVLVMSAATGIAAIAAASRSREASGRARCRSSAGDGGEVVSRAAHAAMAVYAVVIEPGFHDRLPARRSARRRTRLAHCVGGDRPVLVAASRL
jgi:hypothetical protein